MGATARTWRNNKDDMDDNLYSPPQSEVRDLEAPPGSAVKAVLVAAALYLGSAMVVGIVISIVYGTMLASSGMNAEQIAEALKNIDPHSTVSMVGIGIGGFITLLCGYVCARISRRRDYSLAYILMGLDIVATLYFSWGDYSAVEHVLLAALSVVTIMAGTKLGMPKTVAHSP